MGLNIKNAAIEADIRKLARAKKISLTEAVGAAVRRELESLKPARPKRTAEELLADMAAWREKHGIEPGSLSSNHDWLYDENGLPK